MMFCRGGEALVQNALKNMNIKDRGRREGESCKEPTTLVQSKCYGYRKIYYGVCKSLQILKIGLTYSFSILFVCCSKPRSEKSYYCSLHRSHLASGDFSLLTT